MILDDTRQPAYVGIGSNLAEPRRQVEDAITALQAIPQTLLVARSSLYRSAPFGPVAQPDFVNAVAALATGLDVADLFRHLQEIEDRQGRVRSRHDGFDRSSLSALTREIGGLLDGDNRF